jgi:hypothetical protein
MDLDFSRHTENRRLTRFSLAIRTQGRDSHRLWTAKPGRNGQASPSGALNTSVLTGRSVPPGSVDDLGDRSKMPRELGIDHGKLQNEANPSRHVKSFPFIV